MTSMVRLSKSQASGMTIIIHNLLGVNGVFRRRVSTTEIVWSPSVLLDVWQMVIQKTLWLVREEMNSKTFVGAN